MERKYNIHKILSVHVIRFVPFILLLMSISCSTGIESTKKITMNKQDIKLMAKTEEQIFASDIKGTPLAEWPIGKKFMATSPRTLYLFDPVSTNVATEDSMAGRILTYEGIETTMSPDLKEMCVVLMSDGSHVFKYNTGKTTGQAKKEMDSSKLPLLADLSLIEEWKERLAGKTLWTKNNLWYTSDGQRKDGLKFVEVTVTDVEPSAGDFPMRLKIKHGEDTAYMYMNYTADKADSRNFAALFFLSDPKQRYPQITEENWNLIQSGRVGPGMTKEECRLALGNPDELRSGHSTSQTMDIWQYSNGTYLYFTDGLLTSFRQ